MAGIGREFSSQERALFSEIAEKLQRVSAKDAVDLLVNLASDAIAHVSKGLDQADRVADEFAENLKLLIRENHPDIPAASPLNFKRRDLQ